MLGYGLPVLDGDDVLTGVPPELARQPAWARG
jgi:hypothetical protein